jgi:hypothetical protein
LALKLYITRDSVAAGDDIDAPHVRTGRVADESDIEQIVATCLNASPLPNISGGQATWCLSSLVPLAVIAQQWPRSRLVSSIGPRIESLDLRDDILRLHFSYFAQHDPEDVLAVLQRLRLKALG